MKQSRLLEIIREEIAGALGEASYAGKGAIPQMKKDPKYSTLSGDGKINAEKELKTGGTVELEEEKRKKLAEKYQIDEETINEMASIKQLKSELEKQGKEKELQAVKSAEKSTLDALKSDPTITPDGRLKGYVSALKKELKAEHNIILQDLLTQEFFENLIPADINKYAKYNTYDTAEPAIPQEIKSEFDFPEILNPYHERDCIKSEPKQIKSGYWKM